MGIYLHVPFCRSKCAYCGFYSVASSALKEEYLGALFREISSRQGYLPIQEVGTLYIGGGTPSLLSPGELAEIVKRLEQFYRFDPLAEKTLEANPEDLDEANLSAWLKLGFNRLSIGVQSFSDRLLKTINRRHAASTAVNGVRLAADLGFKNISVDMIIGLPGQTEQEVMADLEMAVSLPVNHLSVYMLSVDPGTLFEVKLKQGKLALPEEEQLSSCFLRTSRFLREAGFEHYEISNFARDGHYSRHNTAYWQQKPYIGFGAAAHSYDGATRQWNVSHLKRYINALNNNTDFFEKEILTPSDLYNEYIMTGLRTRWGVDPSWLQAYYPTCYEQMKPVWEHYLANGCLFYSDGRICMDASGWLLSDMIFSDLFLG